MITRRKDYEEFMPRYFAPWQTAWQVKGKIYIITNLLHPGFWIDWWRMWKGSRVRALRSSIKYAAYYWDDARGTNDL